MNRTPPIFRPFAFAPMLVLLVITWTLLAPPAFGGRTSFVIVNGNSMEPVYARGDLVVVRATTTYQIGEIVTYRHPQIGPVIHRIIGRDGDRWLFKGDHNSFIDPFQPREADLIGRAVIHIPLVGRLLIAMRDPRIIAVLVVGAGALFMQRSPSGPRSRRIKSRAAPSGLHTVPNSALFGMSALVAIVALGLSAWVYLQPLQRAQTEEIPYTHTGVFRYHAAAPAGIYDTSAATSGEPVFWQLSNQLEIEFDYQLQADQPATIDGTALLEATLSSADGWRRTLVLSPQQPFTGTVPTIRGTIDLAQIRALIGGLEARAGLPRREYLVTVSPKIQVEGTLAGESLRDTFAPKLVFRSDEFQLSLVRDTEQDPLFPVKGATIKHETLVDQFAFAGLPFNVATIRIAAPILLLLALAVAGATGYPLLHGSGQDESARIRDKYGALLTDAISVSMQPRIEIAVANIDALARIAERHGTVLMRDVTNPQPRYLVCNGETVYTYCASLAPRSLPIPSAEAQVVVGVSPTAQDGWHAVFLQELRLRGLAAEACRTVGIALSDAYRERERNIAFAHAWDCARASALSERSRAA